MVSWDFKWLILKTEYRGCWVREFEGEVDLKKREKKYKILIFKILLEFLKKFWRFKKT